MPFSIKKKLQLSEKKNLALNILYFELTDQFFHLVLPHTLLKQMLQQGAITLERFLDVPMKQTVSVIPFLEKH